MITVKENIIDFIRNNIKATLSLNATRQLINDSWKQSESTNLYVESKNGNERIFCLLLPTKQSSAAFIRISKNKEHWNTVKALFRDVNVEDADARIWTQEVYDSFPELKTRLNELASNTLVGWDAAKYEYVGPDFLDESVVRKMVEENYGVYRDRPYHPSVFGFSAETWTSGIVKHILDAYKLEYAQKKVVEASLNWCVCNIGLTNANRETLYLLINMNSYVYDLSTLARIAIDYPDAKEVLIAGILKCNPKERNYNGSLGYPLLPSWAYCPDEQYKFLQKLLLPERWCFANDENTVENELKAIKKYIENTFVRLLWENKVLIINRHKSIAKNLTEAQWAVFNTGLVNRNYRALYAVFRLNDQEAPIWRLDCFQVAGQGAMHSVPYPPDRADYLRLKQDMFYDITVSNAKNPDIDIEHILIDNFDRLPEIAQKKYLGNDYDRYLAATYPEKEHIRKNRPTNAKNNLSSLFRNALEKSINRAEWNYRTGVPMYYIREGEMTILLPIAFAYEFTLSDNWENESDELPCDLALAMQLQTIEENQKYVARTIFTLDMAYRDARLITRPSSDWLSAELIDSTMEDDE